MGSTITGWSVTQNYSDAQTTVTLVNPNIATSSLVLIGFIISTAVANNISLDDTNGGTIVQTLYFAANGGCVATCSDKDTPIKILPRGAGLRITSSGAGNHSITIWGYEL